MRDFWAYLIGYRIGLKVTDKAFKLGAVILRISKIMISFIAWWTFVEAILKQIRYGSVGIKVLGILILLMIIVSFGYCVYKIETKTRRTRCIGIFSIFCFLVMVLFWGVEFYLEAGQLNALFIVYILVSLTGMWIPQLILKSVEKVGKKSLIVSEIERRVNKYKAGK